MALSYNLQVTGDCQNVGLGAFYLEPLGGNPPYNIYWTSPVLSSDLLVNDVLKTPLSQGDYLVEIYDSTTPTPESITRIFKIGGNLCISIDTQDTTCNQSNGYISVTSNTTTSSVNFYLYNTVTGYQSSAITNSSTVFDSLAPGIYYIDAVDQGGCTGRSSSCVIKPSSDFDFDLVGINNSVCSGPNGRVYVTNQNGQPPYQYLWTNNATTSFISGLTAGNYTVQVTDDLGCTREKSITLQNVEPVGFVGTTLFQPTCFSSNGLATLSISGGSEPFYYLLSTGEYKISYLRTETFSGLSSGLYTATVTDAGLCTSTTSFTLQTPDAFTVESLIISGSTCGLNDGSIYVRVAGGNSNYTFRLYDSQNNLTSISSNNGTANFLNLSSGFYQLIINNGTGCQYEEVITLSNSQKYNFSTTQTNPTCGGSNGSFQINLTNGPTYPCTVEVTGFPTRTINSNTTTYNSLASGTYPIKITDSLGCIQNGLVVLSGSPNVNFNLLTKSCGDGNDGTITALITSGVPPFVITWSSNVGIQYGVYVTGLTSGDYDVTIIDGNGCARNKTTKILCGSISGDYKTYDVCDNSFSSTTNTELGVSEMFFQGYQDLTSGETGCLLNSADFTILVDVGSTAYTSNFYSTISLQDYPSDDDYINALRTLLNTIDGMGSIIIDDSRNIVILSSDCEKTLSAETISVGMRIAYDICCLTTTTTTCQNNNCLQYKLEGPSQGDYLYFDCLGNSNAGVTDNLTFCSDQSFGAIISGPPLSLINLGCCPNAPEVTTTTMATTTTTSTPPTTTTTTEPMVCRCHWVQNFGTIEFENGVFVQKIIPSTFTYMDCTVFPPVFVGPITLSGGPGTGFCSTVAGFTIISGASNLSVTISACDFVCDDPFGGGGGGEGNCVGSSTIIVSHNGSSGQMGEDDGISSYLIAPKSFALFSVGNSIPLSPGDSVSGSHGSWSGPLSIPLGGSPGVGIGCLTLTINGVVEDTTNVTGNGTYQLGTSSTSIANSDCVEITFNNGSC